MFASMRLYLFNPDTDMALANGGKNYLPPNSAHRMAVDLAVLPMWYAETGDGVLAASAYNDAFVMRMGKLFDKDVRLVTEPEVQEYNDAIPMSWGWNASVCRYWRQKGIPSSALPSEDELRRLRQMASREQVSVCLEALCHIPSCYGESVNLYSTKDCQTYVERYNRTVLKAPWSGSGRGLLWCNGCYNESVAGWCNKVLYRQGCVVAAPVYNKVEDFAMEFQSDGKGHFVFIGYSLFQTNVRGAYMGNFLLSDCNFEEWMKQYVSVDILHQVKVGVQKILAHYFADYRGILGVDMMVCRSERYFIHPCVEINLRMNMGVVACQLYKRLLFPGSIGHFCIEYHPSAEALRTLHARDEAESPVVIEKHRLVSGYLPLVPVTPVSHYRAYIKVASPDRDRFHFRNDQWP